MLYLLILIKQITGTVGISDLNHWGHIQIILVSSAKKKKNHKHLMQTWCCHYPYSTVVVEAFRGCSNMISHLFMGFPESPPPHYFPIFFHLSSPFFGGFQIPPPKTWYHFWTAHYPTLRLIFVIYYVHSKMQTIKYLENSEFQWILFTFINIGWDIHARIIKTKKKMYI